MAGHESPRTTKLYDRTKDEITLSEVERIPVVTFDSYAVLARPRNARQSKHINTLMMQQVFARPH